MKWIVFILVVLAIPLLLRFSVMRFGPSEPARSGIDTAGSGFLHSCPETPNCFTIKVDVKASGNSGEKSSGESLVRRISTAIEDENGKLVSSTDNYVQATFQSKLMAFIDDFECLVVDADGNSSGSKSIDDDSEILQLHCRSASRIGRSDFGANKKRVDAVLSRAGIQAA